MSYIYICVGGPPHMYSHTHVNYALQTMCTGRTLRQAALSLREERATCWLVSQDTEREGAMGKQWWVVPRE